MMSTRHTAFSRIGIVAALAIGIATASTSSSGTEAAQAPAPPVAVTVTEQAQWTLQPATTMLQAGETQQFSAFVPNEFRSLVRWAATAGTVSNNGLYTAPERPGSYVVTVTGPGTALTAQAAVQVVAAQGTTTAAADRFVDSVGVNVHLHYNGTLYRDNFPLVKSRLLALGVRHVRDGMIDTTWREYYDRHNELGQAGIKGVFIVDPTLSNAVMQQYPSRVASAFEAYEAPNEYDASGRPNWASILQDTLTRMASLKVIPALAQFPIYGPSLTKEASYAMLGDVSDRIDRANVHDYLAGRNPGTSGWGNNGYGSIPWNLGLLKRYSGGKPIVSTETGYMNGTAADAVPEQVAGKYMPRLLLEHFRMGITRTYLYELCDQPKDSYGLLTTTGDPKPAYVAVRNLLGLLADPGPSVTVVPLRYSVTGGGSDLHHIAFQKRDGSYYLALWLERPAYDVPTRRLVDASSQTVSVTVEGPERLVRSRAWRDDGGVTATEVSAGGSSQTLATVTDRLLVLEYRR